MVKFLLYFLIATLGFSALPSDALNMNEEYPIEEQLSVFEETIEFISPEIKNHETCDTLSINFKNPYWNIVTIDGKREVALNYKEGVHGILIELPKNFLFNGDFSFADEVEGTTILDLELKEIGDNQYLFLQHPPQIPTRIYKDTLDPKKIYIAIAKSYNPYPYKVVLDPGHGGFDPGASYFGVHEKDIVLDIALRMEHKLKDLGIDVVYTRSTDEFIDLYERAYISNDINPNAFISIHNNASKSTAPRGIGTYLYTPNGYQKEERTALATYVQESLTSEFPDWKDWGILWENFCVTRETNNPSILIEFGFLSNPKDRDLLQKEEIRERAAKAITRGINSFVKNNDGY